MLKKSLLCGALALLSISPVMANNAENTVEKVKTSMSDTAITAKIKAMYLKAPLLKSTSISVTTNNGEVILVGKVETDSEYERAVTLAESVDGVAKVDADKLKVKASKSPINDTYLTAKVKGVFLKEKIFGDKEVEVWPVKVETKDGVVELSGEVDSDAIEKNLVQLAKGVSGVKSVKSALTVK